jgi:hypothetical protein
MGCGGRNVMDRGDVILGGVEVGGCLRLLGARTTALRVERCRAEGGGECRGCRGCRGESGVWVRWGAQRGVSGARCVGVQGLGEFLA